MNSDQELNDFTGLDGLKKSEPFHAPEGYLESFNSRLRDRISEEAPVSRSKKPAIGFIVVACLVALVFLIARKDSTEVAPIVEPPTYSELAESNYLYSLEEEHIAEAYAEMFHGTPVMESDEYLLNELDEEVLTSNL